MRIFITGASGCIGHYLVETLIQETNHELFLLVRNPAKLQLDLNARPGIHVVAGNMRQIEQFDDLLKTIDVAILTATAWGDPQETYDVNVTKTLYLMQALDPDRCQQVIYFSTASILNQDNELLKEAGELGTDYIRTKYECFQRLSTLAIAPRITTVFPTLVLGGDDRKPVSHLSSGVAEVTKWIGLIRWLKADASFHFIHGRDIAQVICHLVDHPPAPHQSRKIVLGSPRLTVNQAVEEACAYLNQKIYFRVPLSLWLANFFIAVFRIQMADWDRFCMNYRHFTYKNPTNPSVLGEPTYCATFSDVLKVSGVPPR